MFYPRFDLVEKKLGHQAVCDELDSVFFHLREQLLAVGVDKAHVGEVDQGWQWRFTIYGAAPALFQFADTRACEFSFDEETNVSGVVASSNT